MKRAVWVMAMMLLPSCNPVDPYQQGAQLRMLETVEKGHLCDPRALMQAVAREHPGLNPVTAQRETDHLLHVLGCDLPGSESPYFAEQSAPASPAFPTSPSKGKTAEVQLQLHDGVFALPVVINQVVSIPFVLDSGAADVQLPAEVVFTLMRSGTLSEGDFIGASSYVLANGSTLRSPRFNIREMCVGEYVVRNVAASAGQAVRSDALLGQSFLSKLPSWTLDNKRHVLVMGR